MAEQGALEKYRKLLQQFIELKENSTFKQREKTFMEISGYGHHENSISDILAFFFDDMEEHGFGVLWIESLIDCAKEKLPSTYTWVNQLSYDELNCLEVQREVATQTKNRIDLVLQNSSFTIAIENKIYADLYNDLKDYESHAKEMANDFDCTHKEPLLIVLSIYAQEQAKLGNFINITYDELIAAVQKKLPSYWLQANHYWLLILKDFITTVEHIIGGNVMDWQMAEYIDNNIDDMQALLGKINEYNKDRKNSSKRLQDLLINNINNNKYGTEKIDGLIGNSINTWNEQIYSCVYMEYKTTKDDKLVVETFLDSTGWYVGLFLRNNREKSCRDIQNKLSNTVKSEIRNKMLIVAGCDRDENLEKVVEEIENGMRLAVQLKDQF